MTKPQREPDYVYVSCSYWFKEMVYIFEDGQVGEMVVMGDKLACKGVFYTHEKKEYGIYVRQIQEAFQEWQIDNILLGENDG